MKKYTLIALLPLLFLACSNNEADRQLIIGKWKYDTDTILEEMRQRDDLTDQDINVVEAIMGVYQNAIFDFQEDGTLSLELKSVPQMGKWELSGDSKNLILNLSGRDQVNPVQELSEDRIVLAPIPEQGIQHTRIFIPVEAGTAD